MNIDWINKNLEYLEEKLYSEVPLASTREFSPSVQLYEALFQTGDFSDFLGDLCKYISIPIVPEIEVVGDSDIPRLDLQAGLRFFKKEIASAGDYSYGAHFKPTIRVGASYLRKPHIFAHICAHELAHHFMSSKRIKSSSADENEMLTDLTAVYLGFGKLMINGAKDMDHNSTQKPILLSEQGVAYLGYPLLAYAYFMCQKKRGISKYNQNVIEPCLGYVKAFKSHHNRSQNWVMSVMQFFGLVPRLPDTDGSEIYREAWRLSESRYRLVNCPGCNAKIKIPKTDKKVEIKCSKCNKVFVVGIRYI